MAKDLRIGSNEPEVRIIQVQINEILLYIVSNHN